MMPYPPSLVKNEEVYSPMAGVSVKVKENESFEKALKWFRKEVEKTGVMREIKRHIEYENPSVKRKRKPFAARKRWIKRTRRLNRSS
jgi:small subunit ribosomal protein S21